jgi:defect-in-organelle-trafficking protein DotD
MKYTALSIIPAAFILLLAGCSDKKTVVDLNLKYTNAQTAPIAVTDKNAQSKLAEAAVSVDHSLQEVSAIEMATNPQAKAPKDLNPAAIGMAQQTSLDWTGPIEPLLKKIAAASHYRVRVIGKKPSIPAIITINMNDVPLAEILRNATYQVHKKASVKVYPSKKVIELRYLSS